MDAMTLRRSFALLLSATLLAGLIVVAAVPVGAADDDEEPGIGMDALAGLGADGGGSDASDSALTGDLNDPLAGGTGGTSDGSDADVTGTEPGAADGSDPTDPATSSANPMFKLMLDLILEDVQAAEAKMAGRTLTEAERTAAATRSVTDLIAFLQETELLGDVDTREVLKQIEGIPTEPEE
jgi:hypothetical protein